VGLVLAITLGWCFPAAGVAAAAANGQVAATIGIFVISGLLLQRGETAAALRATSALLYGMLAILAVTPLAAFGVLRLPLSPPEMALGLAVFCCMPTTLSTGVTLTVASSGNAAVALMLTVASNMLAVRLGPANQAPVLCRSRCPPRPRHMKDYCCAPIAQSISPGVHHPHPAVAGAGQRRGGDQL
jgi:sodium/bile acid cotransporter 7